MSTPDQSRLDPPVLLRRIESPGANAPPVPLGWDLHIARLRHHDGLLWLVCPSPGGRVPPETVSSIRQRIESYRTFHPESPYRWHEHDGDFEGLLCPLIEGEQIASYLRSREGIPESTGIALLRHLVAELVRWVDLPEFLENVRAEDFLVSLSYGVRVRVVLPAGFSFLREPRQVDGHSLQWHCLSLVSDLYRIMTRAEGELATPEKNKLQKPFQKLERLWRAKKWNSLEELLDRVDQVLERMGKPMLRVLPSSPKGVSRAVLFATRPEVRPRGMVARFLSEGFSKAYPEKIVPAGEFPQLVPFSPYVSMACNPAAREGERLRYAYLLPPEDWLVDGFVNEINRKLTDPFLKEFKGTTRFRSVFSEEDFTAAVGDPEKGIPLPIYGYLRTIQPGQVIGILRKLARLLDEVESGGSRFHLVTPWQVQLHLSKDPEQEEPGKFAWNHDLERWPEWHVKIRAEKPTEHLIAEPSELCWRWIYRELGEKFFPAIASWLLVLSLIREDEGTARLQTIGFHPNAEISALFQAARDHLREGSGEHRERFLGLLKEGLQMISGQTSASKPTEVVRH